MRGVQARIAVGAFQAALGEARRGRALRRAGGVSGPSSVQDLCAGRGSCRLTTVLRTRCLPVRAMQRESHSGAQECAPRYFRGKDGEEVAALEAVALSKEVLESDILLVGETHDNSAAHRIELDLLEMLSSSTHLKARKIVLSLEFFDTDVQLIMDEYLNGIISEEQFKTLARAPSNYVAAYRPLVEFAKERGLRVIAANAPRRYVSLARKVGREQLSAAVLPEAVKLLPPLPYSAASERYARKFEAIMRALRGGDDGAEYSVPAGMLDAQSLWDAGMAHSITREFAACAADTSTQRPLIVHISGTFHVEHELGIHEHLQLYRPDLKRVSVIIDPGAEPLSLPTSSDVPLGTFVVKTSGASS